MKLLLIGFYLKKVGIPRSRETYGNKNAESINQT